jgi:Ca-activated chloride channel family protein
LAALALMLPLTAHGAGLLIADGGFGGVLEIKQHDVSVTINNGVAVTEVEQVFLNTENRVVEALYVFPVPRGASVSNFSMWIGGKEMVGEVVEKERARQIYESYKQTRRDPGLLEQVNFKQFEMRIFPIPAGAEQRVRVTYQQELDFDHDAATYVYPLATVTRPGLNEKTTGRFSLSLDVKSEVPLVEMVSASHADDFAIVKHDQDDYWQASLETSGGNLGRDVVVTYRVARPRTGVDVITSKRAGEDGYFLLTLTAGKELDDAQGGGDYVFLLDVSGSMANDGKLALSRQSIAAFVQALSNEDRFDVIAFNVGATTLFGDLQPATEEKLLEAAQFLNSQKARGGTVLRPGLQAAYRYRDGDRPLNVVILSDGMTEQREQRDLLELISRRPAGTTVFCVGVGNEVNRPLLTQLANDAGGLAAFLSQGDDFQRQAEAFRRKLIRPAGTNLKINFPGADVYDLVPQQLPNLYYGQPVRLYGRYRDASEAQIQVEAEILGSPFRQTVPIKLPKVDEQNPQIERMWASHRVQELMEAGRRSGNLQSYKPQIVDLCETYSIVSEYASFIVLENDAEYQRWKIQRRNASRIERDRSAQLAVRQQLETLRRQAEQKLGPSSKDDEVAQATSPVPPQRRNNAPSGSTPPPLSQPGSIDSRPATDSGGGGAIDPITALVMAGLLGAGVAARGRKPRNGQKSDA